jgi:hypothetical protein
MTRFTSTMVVLALLAPTGFVGCGDDDDSTSSSGGSSSGGGQAGAGLGGSASEGALECEVVGELCHEADLGSGPAHDCHELGHEGVAATCHAQFKTCIDTCVQDEDGTPSSEQDPKCLALGELCHPVDDKDGPLHECHELGHEGDATACAAAFDDCATKCLAARELLPEPSEGGAGGVSSVGGASSAGASAGGAAEGGVAGMTAGGGGAGGAP